MIREIEIYSPFMGEGAMIRVEYEITHWGVPAIFDPIYGGDPGEETEWEITEIGISLDEVGSEWIVDWRTKQFGLIANSGDVVNAILEDVADQEICRPYCGRRSYWEAA